MDELDTALRDDGLLSGVGAPDFEPHVCGIEPDISYPAFQTNWEMYSDDLFDSLLAAPVDISIKAPAAMKDHDYVSSQQPHSPSSDSGHSSESRSPFTSSASEDTPPPVTDTFSNELDEDLFEAFGISQVNADGTPTTGNKAPDQVPEDFSIDLDLALSDLEADTACTQDMCLLLSMPIVLPFTMQQAKTLAATAPSARAACPELRLTDEEKELLSKEGVNLPTNMPLTKSEERVLRSVRRRIRNKQSARNSRKKKQDYMDNLEERVKMCSDEKKELEKKVTLLEKQNAFLMTQLRRLQNALRIDGSKPAKATTCALVLALSFALFIVPSLSPLGSAPWGSSAVRSPPMAGRSRNLLEIEEADQSRLAESVWEVRAYIQDTVSRYSAHGAWLALLPWPSDGGVEEASGNALLDAAKANHSALADDVSQPAVTDAAAGMPRLIIVAGTAASDVSDVRHDDS